MKYDVPIWQKACLTIEEASAYSNIGEKKIREMSDDNNCPYVIWVGNKKLIKRKKFEDYLDNQYSV